MSGDGIIYQNDRIALDWAQKKHGFKSMPYPAKIPEGAGPGRVSDPTMDEFKAHKERACVDKLVCTRLPDGTPAILYGLRDLDQPFGGKWWMQGGQLGAYESMLEFVASRAKVECGVAAAAEVLIGVFRTSAEDVPTSTTQPCYATYVPYDKVVASMKADENHKKGLRLIPLPELEAVTAEDIDRPGSPWHWYPVYVARLALRNMMNFGR